MINNNQKGVSVYMTIIILSVLLSVSLGLTSVIVGGAKVASSLSNSVKAFHAADTGIEKALYNIRILSQCSNFNGTLAPNYTYDVEITGANCLETGTSIKSIGTYNTTNRKVEAYY